MIITIKTKMRLPVDLYEVRASLKRALRHWSLKTACCLKLLLLLCWLKRRNKPTTKHTLNTRIFTFNTRRIGQR